MPPETTPQPSKRHTCSKCTTTWNSLRIAHCAGCHRTFTSSILFDWHRTHGTCINPATIVTRDGAHRLRQLDNGHWTYPARPEGTEPWWQRT